MSALATQALLPHEESLGRTPSNHPLPPSLPRSHQEVTKLTDLWPELDGHDEYLFRKPEKQIMQQKW